MALATKDKNKVKKQILNQAPAAPSPSKPQAPAVNSMDPNAARKAILENTSFKKGNLDVTFDKNISPAARKAFLSGKAPTPTWEDMDRQFQNRSRDADFGGGRPQAPSGPQLVQGGGWKSRRALNDQILKNYGDMQRTKLTESGETSRLAQRGEQASALQDDSQSFQAKEAILGREHASGLQTQNLDATAKQKALDRSAITEESQKERDFKLTDSKTKDNRKLASELITKGRGGSAIENLYNDPGDWAGRSNIADIEPVDTTGAVNNFKAHNVVDAQGNISSVMYDTRSGTQIPMTQNNAQTTGDQILDTPPNKVEYDPPPLDPSKRVVGKAYMNAHGKLAAWDGKQWVSLDDEQ